MLIAAAAIGLVLLTLLGAGAAAALWRDGERDPPLIAVAGGAVVALDAGTGSVRRRLSAGRTPSAIAAREGVVWVVDADDRN